MKRFSRLLQASFLLCAAVAASDAASAAGKRKPSDAPAAAEPAEQKPAPGPAAEPQKAAAPVAPVDPNVAEIQASIKAGLDAATRGPAKAPLLDQASLLIPADQAFIPKAEGLRILRALGNSPSETDFLGLAVGLKDDDSWIVVVRYIKEGYIKDDDAKNWNADELLANLKEGTEAQNKDRETRGFQPIEVVGWIEKPSYDSKPHRLVWSLLSKLKSDPDDAVKGVNYNTYALGRDGYFSLNMLTDSAKVEQYRPVAKALLANLSYNVGKRYEDFNESTDKIAAYGLAALVGGVAAKKLGLLALGAAFFAKFAKLILVGVAAVSVGVAKFFRRGKGDGAA